MTGTPMRAMAERRMGIALWCCQALLTLLFCFAGVFKLSASIADLATAMKWPGDFPPGFVRFLGAVDLCGGVGVLLPALTRIAPGLGVLAAAGCVVLQLLACGFHLARGEVSVLPLNAVLLGLAVFVLWGRHTRIAIVGLDGRGVRRRLFAISVWSAQAVAAAIFCGAGMFKISAPIPDLAAALRWPADLPAGIVRMLGMVDLAGALGLILPALTRIRPHLTVLAAAGCVVLQLLAIGFHSARREFDVYPLNFLLLSLAAYVLWARSGRALIAARISVP